MINFNCSEDQFEDFTIAIVKMAVVDYVESLRQIKHGNKYSRDYVAHLYYDTVERKKDLEDFFNSDWCFALSNTDGSVLIDKARKSINFDNEIFKAKEAWLG